MDIITRIAHEQGQAALFELGDKLGDARTVPDTTITAARWVANGLLVDRVGFGPVDKLSETIDMPTDWCAPGIVSVAGKHTIEIVLTASRIGATRILLPVCSRHFAKPIDPGAVMRTMRAFAKSVS